MVDASSSLAGMEPQLELFDAQGTLLASDTTEASATIEFTAGATATFYVLASDAGQNQSGSYTITVDKI